MFLLINADTGKTYGLALSASALELSEGSITAVEVPIGYSYDQCTLGKDGEDNWVLTPNS
jgi:hypothetical protein